MVAPIDRIPPEILALIPDFWETDERDQDVITLTHVCRAWRDIFISRSSLWADIRCDDREKSLVYFERSRSSPISLSLYRDRPILPHDPFFEIIPHAIDRLVSLFIQGAPENLQDITGHFCHPAPLLKELTIRSINKHRNNVLPPALLNGDLSSLHTLYLESVRTELPWRNMVNLTSFTLGQMSSGEVSVRQLLDFFEDAPHLRNINLYSITLTPGAKDGRVVTPGCLKKMAIVDCGPPSALLDHLFIPVGAILTMQADLTGSLAGEIFPRSIDNLRNFSDFTTIQLSGGGPNPQMKFGGPNGRVNVILTNTRVEGTRLVLESLAQLDTSKTEQLVIERGQSRTRECLHQALLPMTNLRTLTLSKCWSPQIFIQALQPGTSSSEVVVCPKLEELIVVPLLGGGSSGIMAVIGMAAARALRGMKLGTVRIGCREDEFNPSCVSELREHTCHVECDPELVWLTVDTDEED